MPTIRELVNVIAQREGVEAAIVLGHDGLLIDGRTTGTDAEPLAALTPGIVAAARDLSASAAKGELVSAVLEFERGIVLITTLTSDALLLVVMNATANVGALVYELRSHRGHIASIV